MRIARTLIAKQKARLARLGEVRLALCEVMTWLLNALNFDNTLWRDAHAKLEIWIERAELDVYAYAMTRAALSLRSGANHRRRTPRRISAPNGFRLRIITRGRPSTIVSLALRQMRQRSLLQRLRDLRSCVHDCAPLIARFRAELRRAPMRQCFVYTPVAPPALRLHACAEAFAPVCADTS